MGNGLPLCGDALRVSKLYRKILLSFLAVLIAVEAIVLGIFLQGGPPAPVVRNMVERTAMTRDLFEKEMRDIPYSPQALESRLEPLAILLGKGFHARIWITDAAGNVVLRTFKGKTPSFPQLKTPVDQNIFPDVRLSVIHHDQTNRSLLMLTPLRLEDTPELTVHVLMNKRAHKEEKWFLRGLLLLTFLGALFFIPVSRTITKPLRELSEAADRLGEGDLSQRAKVRGKDEVAVLARKFNVMAENLEKMVMSGKELTANLSHELRSPLARMRVSLQILMEQKKQGAQSEALCSQLLGKLQTEIEKMDTLIGHILDLSKLDMREPLPREDMVDPSGQLKSLIDSYGPMLEKGEFHLEANYAETPRLRCHRHSLAILLDNVLGNAIKYTPNGGTITVTLQSAEDAACIRICNDHPPLTEQQLEDMFQPFHRLDKGKKAGTGLGLVAASKIVQIHRGSISATYASGRVCIRISLPYGEYPPRG